MLRQRFFQVLNLAGAGNRQHDSAAFEYPRERDLARRESCILKTVGPGTTPVWQGHRRPEGAVV